MPLARVRLYLLLYPAPMEAGGGGGGGGGNSGDGSKDFFEFEIFDSGTKIYTILWPI